MVKLCRVQYHRTGFFVHFPYHPDMPGLLSKGKLLPGGGSQQVDLRREGAVTSHKVKYTHHLDGRCHFSQDGKIRTTARGQTAPLSGDAGHMFTLDVRGAERFASYPRSRYYSDMEGSCYFEVQSETLPPSLHLTGWWKRFPSDEFHDNLDSRVRIKNEGRVWEGMALGLPPGSPLSPGVLVICMEIGHRLSDDEFLLLFTAGFHEGVSDPTVEAELLALKYPVGDPSGLPSVDL